MSIIDSNMSLQNKSTRKYPMIEAYAIGIHEEEEEDTLEPIYDDTTRFIEKMDSLKWGEVFQMVKKWSLPIES